MTLSTSAQAAPAPDAEPTRGAPSTSTGGQRAVLDYEFMAMVTEATAGAVERLRDGV
jgi:hypothetical protein